MSFPCKSEREKCWNSRDVLWKCLDEQPDNPELCSKFREAYISMCPSQWVKHFDRKREYLKFKDRIQNDGGNRIEKDTEKMVKGGAELDLLGSNTSQNRNLLTVPSLAVAVTVDGTMSSAGSDPDHLKDLSPTAKRRVIRKFQPWTFT